MVIQRLLALCLDFSQYLDGVFIDMRCPIDDFSDLEDDEIESKPISFALPDWLSGKVRRTSGLALSKKDMDVIPNFGDFDR